ncbi:MAG: glycerophosphodiester phosphodiesterase [Proteobacteria bacterium]|nr:glycerophosphodiester phosphodiesterase [Pseudomonadota bacterium]
MNLLVEIKPPREISKTMHISREVARIIRDKPSGKKIIVDSFNGVIVDSVKRHCQCEVGIDTPYGEKISLADLQQFKKSNIDWIYVHYSVIDQVLIRNAHDNGLKVMAYTVNLPETIELWKANQLPDGIITDDINIMYKFNTSKLSSAEGE